MPMSKIYRLLTIGICTVILIAACDRQADLPENFVTPTSSESCRLVSHEMGTTEVCGQPQKVAALSPHILDSILALGVQPAAYAEVVELKIPTYDNPASQIPYIGKWVKTQPIGLGDRYSPSLERLTLLKPDLILGEKSYNHDEYTLLTQIAPTLLFSDTKNPNEPQSWQQNIEGIAKALGREAQAQELLASFEEHIATARKKLQPVLKKYPRVSLFSTNFTTYVYSQPESTTGKLLQKIGFEIVEPPGISGEGEISWEILPQVDTDLIIVLSSSNDSFSNPEAVLQEKWANHPLLNSMPVFQQDRVFFVDYQLWGSNIRGPLTDRLILEALPDLLLSSAAE